MLGFIDAAAGTPATLRGTILVPYNQQAFEKGDLKQPKTKTAEPLQPSLRVCTVAQEKNCYSLYGATSEMDHIKFYVVSSPTNAKLSSDCLEEPNPSTDHPRMAIQLCWVQQ